MITGLLAVFERRSTCTPVGLSESLFPGSEVVTVVLTITVRFFESPWTKKGRQTKTVYLYHTWEVPAKQNGRRKTRFSKSVEFTIQNEQTYLKLSLSRLPRCRCLGGLTLPCLPDLNEGEYGLLHDEGTKHLRNTELHLSNRQNDSTLHSA